MPSGELDPIAALWARRSKDGMSRAEQVEFKSWLAADPHHRRAFAKANRARVDCDWAWQTGVADEVFTKLKSRAARRRRRRTAVAACAAVCLGVGGIVWQTSQPTITAPVAPATSLVVIRPAQQTLPDGSIVELKDGARVSADFGGSVRAVALSAGTAFFQVAKDPQRPFIVQAGGMAVRAVGTAFTVEIAPEELTVLVTEGRVRVDSETAPAAAAALPSSEPLVSIDAGHAVVLPVATVAETAPLVRPIGGAELQQQLGWRIPKLEFTATALREVIARMNEHGQRKFVLGDETVGDLRVSGLLRADKMEILAELLETDFGVRVERRPGEIILRSPK